MGLAKAQPPAELGILARPAEELRQERGKLLDRATERFAGKERPQDRIALHPCVERDSEPPADRVAANVLVQVHNAKPPASLDRLTGGFDFTLRDLLG
jgi:hypothetical protein